MEIEPTVYFYRLPGETDAMSSYCKRAGIEIEFFDMNKIDYYSLPNIIPTMKTTRYSLVDEIMGTPLLTLKQVFNQ